MFVMAMSIVAFVAAWGLFLGGAVWSHQYYNQYYCSPEDYNALAAQKHDERVKVEVVPQPSTTAGGHLVEVVLTSREQDLWSEAVREKCFRHGRAVRMHFPTKLHHWIPPLILSIVFAMVTCFQFRRVRNTVACFPEEESESDKQQCVAVCNMVRYVFLFCTACFWAIGLIVAIVFLILMLTFVDVNTENKKHATVPALTMFGACLLLSVAIALFCCGKWLWVRERNNQSWDDEDEEKES
jgi:hypothetical protein